MLVKPFKKCLIYFNSKPPPLGLFLRQASVFTIVYCFDTVLCRTFVHNTWGFLIINFLQLLLSSSLLIHKQWKMVQIAVLSSQMFKIKSYQSTHDSTSCMRKMTPWGFVVTQILFSFRRHTPKMCNI